MSKVIQGWIIPTTDDKFTTDWGVHQEDLNTKLAQTFDHVTGKVVFSAIGTDYTDFLTVYTTSGTSAVTIDTINKKIYVDSLVPNRVLVADANKGIVTSTITTTELGYLSGVSANIQSQLNILSASQGTMYHNSLSGIQGGSTNDYYHMTGSNYGVVSGITSGKVSNWDSAYSNVNSNSATWNSTSSKVASSSASWDGSTTLIGSSSANWNASTSVVNTTSGTWNNVVSVVNNTSATWNTQNNHTHNSSAITNFNTAVSSVTSAVYEPKISTSTSASVLDGNKNWKTLFGSDGKILSNLYTSGGGSVTTGNLTESTSNILTISGGTNAVVGTGTTIQVSQASTNSNGFITSSDWNSFNLKASSADLRTTEDVISTVSAGAIVPGNTITSGTTLTDFVKALLLRTYYPTFVAPSVSVVNTSGSTNIEAGTSATFTITETLNRGSIVGKTVAGIWQPATQQDYRSGLATKYVIGGVDNGTSASRTISNFQVVDGTNTWTYSVNYDVGPQPVDSLGANYSSPLASGTLSGSTTLTGRRKAFYGTDSSSDVPYTLSSQVRLLAGVAWSPANGSTFTINIPIGAKMVVFAYPSTLRDVNSVLYVEGLNAEVKSIFTQTTISVEAANAYSPTNYKVYTYVPASPFSATATYNVTI